MPRPPEADSRAVGLPGFRHTHPPIFQAIVALPCDYTLQPNVTLCSHIFRPLLHSFLELPDSVFRDLHAKSPRQPLFLQSFAQALLRRTEIGASAGHLARRVYEYVP